MKISNPRTLVGNRKLATEDYVNDLIGADITKKSSLLENKGAGVYKLREDYNPGVTIKFNDQSAIIGATTINFAGTVSTFDQGDGKVKVQIGDNMNSSSWNDMDGKTTATVPDITTTAAICPNATGATFKVGNWTTGTSIQATKTASNAFTSGTGNVHFNDGNNVWTITVFDADGTTELRKATVTDNVVINYGTAVAGTTTGLTFTPGSVIYSIGSTGITTSITGQAVEDNYPKAVGARARRTFTFDLSNIFPSGGRGKVKIEGCGGSFTSKDFFFCTGVAPTIASATLAVNSQSLKQISGISYLTTGTTFTLTTGNLGNLNNQLAISGTKVAFGVVTGVVAPAVVAGNIFSAPLVGCNNNYNNTCTYSNTAVAIASTNVHSTTASVNVNVLNYFASAAPITATLNNVLISTSLTTASTAMVESFYTESGRLSYKALPVETSFNSAATLVGTNELQIIPTVSGNAATGLQYPTTNYTTVTAPTGNPNYTGMTGTKYYTRKFTKGGSLPGGKFTLTHNASLQARINAGTLNVDVSKNGTIWYDIARLSGIGLATSTFGATSTVLDFGFKDGDASSGFVYFRISMTEAVTEKITNVTMA